MPFQMNFDMGMVDLNPISVGERALRPGSCMNPPMTNAVVIYLVRRGSGKIEGSRGICTAAAGQAFVILPGESAVCRAGEGGIWDLAWVGFNGKLAYRFSDLPPVFTPPAGTLRHLRVLQSDPARIGLFLTADLLELYGRLLDLQHRKQDMISSVLEYIGEHYMHKLSVESLALRFHMEGRHLSRCVRERTGLCLRAYITEVRMNQAKELLAKGAAITETAVGCGFSSPSNFHKIFTAHCGISPVKWMKQNGRRPDEIQ